MIMDTLKLAALCGLIAPFIIVGVGVVLGLTLAISQTMLGLVIGLMSIFGAEQEDE